MSKYREGYEYYVAKCMDFGLEPINFYYYVLHLSREQLDAYNEQAKRMNGSLSEEHGLPSWV
ncbi:transcriptional regulator [Lysinibacillus yapensis]|uniref:Transcriptional regulator n=1 Tax=Ureibacillus yapensis TaxID=2304605 RepID=A0A396S9S9_9BACL|nr:transcriptional regulator [Lysinibacillus yapensis]RHW37541.1 transcriptional regulator [Lysinibacillus yapensis]